MAINNLPDLPGTKDVFAKFAATMGEIEKMQMKEQARARNRPTIDLNNFEGINLKVGNEIIFISKEELLEVMFKLFPNLVEKYTTAVFSEE